MQLITLEEFKQLENIDKEDTSKDLILNLYIDGISELIEDMIGRDILAQDYVEKYAGTNSNALILKHYPINSVKSIKYVSDGTVIQELDTNLCEINSKSGILYNDLAWWEEGGSTLMSRRINFPRRHIRVEYNAGYKEVPADLKLLTLQTIREQLGIDNSQGLNKGLKSYSISDVKMEWKEEVKFSESQLKVISKYRGVRI
jgi:hypothetical protein